jgi:hypothetical protein
MLMLLNAGVVNVDSEEVTKNTLVPGLQIFRVLNQQDSAHRLYHGYQFLFTGDLQLAAKGMLNCTVVAANAVEVVMPACADIFVHNFAGFERAALGKFTLAEMEPLPTAVSKMVKDKDLQKIKVLILFDKTGEELTNAVFSPTKEQLGAVLPKTVTVSDTFEEAGSTFHRTTLFVSYFIPRVELEERVAKIGTPVSSNLVGDALANHVQGMGFAGGGDMDE